MTKEELNAIRYLTIGLAKETFKQDYEGFGKEDDDYIREKIVLDSYCEGVEDVLKILRNMKQEPIKGHWKVVSDGYGDNAYICECSECKDTVWVYKDADRKWNYCPNCGADMREV